MFRNYLLMLLLTVGLFSLPGCSMFSSEGEDGGEEAVSEESSDYSDDVMSDGGEGSEEVVAEGESELDSDSSMESSTTESSTEEIASNDEEEVIDDYPDDDYGSGETASNELPEQPVESEESLYVQGEAQESPVEPTSDTIVDTSSSESAGFVPVKKMKRTPYNAGGVLLNRLYIARSGDTLGKVAEKIYGDSGRSRDLAAWNSSLGGRGLQVGDKVYYNSPRNPSDSSQILLYYEEAGMQPQYYTSQSGDSIRKVSQNLLGHSRSWMEVWATNEVESKWQLPQGTSLRYWPDGMAAAPVQQVAQNLAPAPAPEPEPAPVVEEQIENTQPPQDVAMEEPMGEAPSDSMGGDDMGAAGQIAQNQEPPPPPPQNMAPPPPPPPADAVAPPQAEVDEGGAMADMMNGEDDTTMIAILGGLLLVAAFILLIFLKRSRKKVNYG